MMKNPEKKIQNAIKDSLAKIVNLQLASSKILSKPIILTKIKIKKLGDYATNAAMILKKYFIQNEIEEIANLIIENIDKNSFSIKKIEFKKPGFINFFVDENFLADEIKNLYLEKKDYFKKKMNQTIYIEYLSANPTGFLHIGHLRGAILGNSLGLFFENLGYQVYREYYVNDYGNQIDNLVKSVIYFSEFENKFSFSKDEIQEFYKGSEIKIAAKKAVEIFGKNFDLQTQKNYQKLKQFTLNFFILEIKKLIEKNNLKFENFYYESNLYKNNKIEKIIHFFKTKKLVYFKNEAMYLKTKNFGDDKDRVIIKKDNSFSYFLPDIVYHLEKFNKFNNLKKIINIWGADHLGYIPRIKAAMKMLNKNFEELEILTINLVKLIKNNKEIKMSKRKGTSIFWEDIFKLVPKDEVYFFILHRSYNSNIDLRVENFVKQNENNPLLKIKKNFSKVEEILKLNCNKNNLNLKNILHIEAEDIFFAKKLIEIKKIIDQVSKTLKINYLTQYLIDLNNELELFLKKITKIKTGQLILLFCFKIIFNWIIEIFNIKIIKGK